MKKGPTRHVVVGDFMELSYEEQRQRGNNHIEDIVDINQRKNTDRFPSL